MSTEQNRFPLKAVDHPEFCREDKHLGQTIDGDVVLTMKDYEALAACWHALHGERATRVECKKSGTLIICSAWKDKPNATLILDEEKK